MIGNFEMIGVGLRGHQYQWRASSWSRLGSQIKSGAFWIVLFESLIGSA
jgi:hypothetical protein